MKRSKLLGMLPLFFVLACEGDGKGERQEGPPKVLLEERVGESRASRCATFIPRFLPSKSWSSRQLVSEECLEAWRLEPLALGGGASVEVRICEPHTTGYKRLSGSGPSDSNVVTSFVHGEGGFLASRVTSTGEGDLNGAVQVELLDGDKVYAPVTLEFAGISREQLQDLLELIESSESGVQVSGKNFERRCKELRGLQNRRFSELSRLLVAPTPRATH